MRLSPNSPPKYVPGFQASNHLPSPCIEIRVAYLIMVKRRRAPIAAHRRVPVEPGGIKTRLDLLTYALYVEFAVVLLSGLTVVLQLTPPSTSTASARRIRIHDPIRM
jgi:hypothetical protein